MSNQQHIVFIDKGLNEFSIYNIPTNSWKHCDSKISGIEDYVYDEKYIYCITEHNELYKYDINEEYIVRIDLPNEVAGITAIVDAGNCLKLFFEYGDRVVEVEKNNHIVDVHTMKALDDELKHYYVEVDDAHIMIRHHKDALGSYMYNDEYYTLYNYITGETKQLTIELVNPDDKYEVLKDYSKECWKAVKSRNEIWVENQQETIHLLHVLVNLLVDKGQKNIEECCGKKIHQVIMHSL